MSSLDIRHHFLVNIKCVLGRPLEEVGVRDGANFCLTWNNLCLGLGEVAFGDEVASQLLGCGGGDRAG